MNDFTYLAAYALFSDAAARAKAFAEAYSCQTAVLRFESGWLVLIPCDVRSRMYEPAKSLGNEEEEDDYTVDAVEPDNGIRLWNSAVSFGDHPSFVVFGD